MPAGNQGAGWSGGGNADPCGGLLPVQQFGGPQGLFGDGHSFQNGAFVGHQQHWFGRPRHGGTGDLCGVRAVLSDQCVCAQFGERPEASGLPSELGFGLFQLLEEVGGKEAGDCLWRF